MRCLSAFASFDCAKKIQTLTHSQIHLAKWENVSVAPSCGNSCCRQQSSINLACILYHTDTHATCALLCLCLEFSLLFFSAFALHFFSVLAATRATRRCLCLCLRLCRGLRVSCGCVVHDKRSINSQVAVDAGASTCLASAGELRRAVRYNIATCRIRNVTSFTLWPTKVRERERGGERV